VWHSDPRQNQETRVVGYQPKVPLPLLGRPTDKAVPVLTLPSCGSKNRTGQGTLLPILNQVLQVLSNRPAKAQIMKLAQCCSDPRPLSRLPADFFHPQGLQMGQSADDALSRFE
jgi:hypothetical protein